MQKHNGHCYLELNDLVRMNQLIRGTVDIQGFEHWYRSINDEQRHELLFNLIEFAHQAGVTDEEINKAAALAHVEQIADKIDKGKARDLHEWWKVCSEQERFDVFRLAVFAFGIAEERIFSRETRDCCNHWWHRDLLNPLVVLSLHNDPSYYQTSMKDDDKVPFRIFGQWWHQIASTYRKVTSQVR